LLNHRFVKEARGTQNLVHLIKRYEGWVALAEEEELDDQPLEQNEYIPDKTLLTHSRPTEQWDETWDFGTVRPSYGHNTGVRRYASRNASGTMRIVNSAQAREPLQPLPAVQRPLTPPESQRHPAKYGGMARNEREPSSPKKEGNLQISTREEIDLYDSPESDVEPVEYYDFEDDGQGIVTSTVKISDRRLQEPSSTGWQVSNHSQQVRSPSPPKPVAQSRTASQVTTSAQSRYARSDGTSAPVRSSATSSTAVPPTSPASPAFGANFPPRPPGKQPQRQYDVLEDILLPALDEVRLELIDTK
jgi:hypothetical protein